MCTNTIRTHCNRITDMTLVKGHGTDADREFKAALKARLNAKQFPAYRLAMDLDISQGQLSGILNDTQAASLGQMEKIAKNLETSVGDMLMEGKILLGTIPDRSKERETEPNAEAIEAFRYLMLIGGEAAEVLVKAVIDLAERKQAESEDPTRRKEYKSAS